MKSKGAPQNIAQYVALRIAYFFEKRVLKLERENQHLRALLAQLTHDWGECQECKMPFGDDDLRLCNECGLTLCAQCTRDTGAHFETCAQCTGDCCVRCNVRCQAKGCERFTGCGTCPPPPPPGGACEHRLCEQHAYLNECHACL